MNSQQFPRHPNRHNAQSMVITQDTLLERLQQPSVLVPILLLIFTILYQSRHTLPLAPTRHPGELLWDFVVAVTPASLLYTLDDWINPPMFPVPRAFRPPQPTTYAAKSEVLQRILGMDKPGGIMTSVANVGRKGLSTLSNNPLIKRNTHQPAGLGNFDNSCFQNSILQGLASLKPLPNYLASAIEDGHDKDRSVQAGSAGTLRQLVADLRDAENNGKTLWTPGKLKSLDTWHQQDAQEYYFKLLDEIDKEVAKAAKTFHKPLGLESTSGRDDSADSQHSDDSGYQSIPVLSKASSDAKVLRNPLEGLAAQRVACVQCGYTEGLSMIPFNCLTLSLGLGQMEHDLYELLDSYTHLEAIEGVMCPKCTLLKVHRLLKIIIDRSKDSGIPEDTIREPISRLEAVELALEEDDFDEKTLREKCKISNQHQASSTKTKQIAIARPPQSLSIHMNRSVFDERTGATFKNLAAVRFPKTLDLGPWCLGSADGTRFRPKTVLPADKGSWSDEASDEEEWLSDAKTSMVSGDRYPSKITGPLYELRAVVTHQGQHQNGHYVCYRKHPRSLLRPDDTIDAKPPSLDGVEEVTTEEETAPTNVAEFDDSDMDEDQWWRFSDESVWEVSEETVLAQGGVFMLFYDCVDPNSVLVSEVTSQVSKHAGAKATTPSSTDDRSAQETDEAFYDTPSDEKEQEQRPNHERSLQPQHEDDDDEVMRTTEIPTKLPAREATPPKDTLGETRPCPVPITNDDGMEEPTTALETIGALQDASLDDESHARKPSSA